MNALLSPQNFSAIAEIEAKLKKATGAPNAHAAMRRLCSSVVQASRQSEPPIKIKPLLDVLGVKFEYEPSSSGVAEASIALRDDRLVVEVPKTNFKGNSGRYSRWRFSLAHEFAHVVLIRTLGARIVELTYHDNDSYKFVESLCDYAASHILLPRSKVAEVLWRQGFSKKSVQDTMARFHTSESAVLRAIHDFLPGGAIFTIRSFRRHENENIEPRIVFCSTIYSRDGSRPWLPRDSTAAKHVKLVASEELERVIVSLREVEWRLEGMSSPWFFGPSQRDMFGGGATFMDQRLSADVGQVVVCAAIGKFNAAMFRTREVE